MAFLVSRSGNVDADRFGLLQCDECGGGAEAERGIAGRLASRLDIS